MRKRLAAALVATIAAAVLAAPVLAGHRHQLGAGTTRSGSAIVAAKL
jgi:hypothetical protein